jgi:hypothetical protein
VNVVAEDPRNPDLLYVGTDAGLYVSLDRGATWVRMNNNMPAVPVHDLLVHPRDLDLVLGTYGRDVWITNVSALEELTPSVLGEAAHLFTIRPTTQRVTWQFGANDYLFGQRHASTPNEPSGMLIRYYLGRAVGDSVAVTIADSTGAEVARLKGPGAAGIHTIVWSTRRPGPPRGAGAASRPVPGTAVDQLFPLGRYTVTLDAGGTRQSQPAEIVRTQGWPIGAQPAVIRQH